MKKIIAAILALTIVTGVAAPTFAVEANANCKYSDAALCGGVAKSLLDTAEENE